MGDLARRSFSESWIDAEPRSGKVGGAYCMWLTSDQSRIMMNFEPNYGGVITLAHELGHAYHNWTLRDRTPMQRDLPMTLAETASTFCETLVRSGALETAGDHDSLLILDGFIGTALAVVIDISSRYQFEQAVIDTRRTRDLSAPELCEIMRQAQLDTYGDGLDPDGLFPWAWAAKPHYYSVGWPFYNYPYMFGLLFGLGLYAIYQREPDTFRDAYDQLLGASGMADARTLARGFGIDLADAAFWRASLDVVGADIDRAIGLMERLARA
jgi:oligoendopeptidase F